VEHRLDKNGDIQESDEYSKYGCGDESFLRTLAGIGVRRINSESRNRMVFASAESDAVAWVLSKRHAGNGYCVWQSLFCWNNGVLIWPLQPETICQFSIAGSWQQIAIAFVRRANPFWRRTSL
jgi:hypothetical protein